MRSVQDRLKRPDVLAGLMFAAVATFGLYLSADYEIGTVRSMSTGYVPRLVCWCLLALGLVILAMGLRAPDEGRSGDGQAHENDGESRSALRPVVFVAAAIAVFGMAIEPLGLALATLLLVAVGAFATRETRLWETVLVALCLIVGSAAVFVWGLGLPMSLWPGA